MRLAAALSELQHREITPEDYELLLRLDESVRHARDAWASLPGCEATPADPYSDAYLDRLVDRVRPRLRGRKLPWSAVMASFTHALQRSCFENLVLVSVYDGKVAAAACANTSVGALTHYREFKFALVSALAGLGPEGSKPPDVAFILDLTVVLSWVFPAVLGFLQIMITFQIAALYFFAESKAASST